MRVLFGAAIGLLALALLWYGAILDPPELLRRKMAVYAAVFPGDVAAVEIDPIPCSPLKKIRLYVVCDEECVDIWRVVAIRGLQPTTITDLGRIPREASGTARRRFNALVGREVLQLDIEGAREMIGCYMRLDGLRPELILPNGARSALDAARGSEQEMRRLSEELDRPGAVSRLNLVESAEGYATEFDYWDTASAGRPVVKFSIRLSRGGQFRSVQRRELEPAPSPTAASPGRPPA